MSIPESQIRVGASRQIFSVERTMVIENIEKFLADPPQDLRDPRLYLNRELSWLRFNDRVLE